MPSSRPSFEVIPPERGHLALGGAKRRVSTQRTTVSLRSGCNQLAINGLALSDLENQYSQCLL